MAFLVWADIRADQMHIETAFRSHCNCDGFTSFMFLFSPLLFSSTIGQVGNLPFPLSHTIRTPAVLSTFLLPSDDFLDLELDLS